MRKGFVSFLKLLIVGLCLGSHVGTAIAAVGFDGRYSTRVGDMNSDGRQDIFVQYKPAIALIPFDDDLVVPIPTTKAPVSEFLLRGNASNSFDLISSLTSQEKSAARQWQAASMPLVRGDYNADGAIDVRVKNIGTVISGAKDTIVFGPATAGSAPVAKRDLDTATMHFIDDLSGWVQNPAYFESGWFIEATTFYYNYYWPTYLCGGVYYPSLENLNPGGGPDDPIFGAPGGSSNGLPNGGVGCTSVGSVQWGSVAVDHWVYDDSSFDSRSMDAARTLVTYRNGGDNFVISSTDLTVLKQIFGQVLGVTVGGGTIAVDPPAPPPTISWSWLRWIAARSPLILLAMIINIAFPNATADDDTFNFFHHYGHLANAASIATGGLWAPVFLTQGRIMTGQEAQVNLALTGPIRDAVYFVRLPKSWALTGPRPVLGGGDGWMEWISAEPVPAVYVSPPRPLPPS